MKKIRGIQFVLITTLIQLVMILLSYVVLYGIARTFHQPYVRMSSSDGMDFYPLMLIYLTWFVIIFVPLTNFIQELFNNEVFATLIHASWIIFIIWFTFGSLKHRPYDYGLILFCIILTLPIRIYSRKLLHE
jgi:hypothetical protein